MSGWTMPEARTLLEGVGAEVHDGVARIPESAVRAALATVPRSFTLHARDGSPAVRYGVGEVAFDPGSCGVAVLDPETGEHRPSTAADLVRLRGRGRAPARLRGPVHGRRLLRTCPRSSATATGSCWSCSARTSRS